MEKSEFKYYEMKDKVKFKLNSKVENPVLELKAGNRGSQNYSHQD